MAITGPLPDKKEWAEVVGPVLAPYTVDWERWEVVEMTVGRLDEDGEEIDEEGEEGSGGEEEEGQQQRRRRQGEGAGERQSAAGSRR
jgi:hypothetical protein